MRKLRLNSLYKDFHSTVTFFFLCINELGGMVHQKPSQQDQDILNTTDSFQYRIESLLSENDYVLGQKNTNSTIKCSIESPIHRKNQESVFKNAQGSNNESKHPQEIPKFRRKSDISAWSGGVSHFESKTVFLTYYSSLKNEIQVPKLKLDLRSPKNEKKRGTMILDSPTKVRIKSFTALVQRKMSNLEKPSQRGKLTEFIQRKGTIISSMEKLRNQNASIVQGELMRSVRHATVKKDSEPLSPKQHTQAGVVDRNNTIKTTGNEYNEKSQTMTGEKVKEIEKKNKVSLF